MTSVRPLSPEGEARYQRLKHEHRRCWGDSCPTLLTGGTEKDCDCGASEKNAELRTLIAKSQ